MVLPPHQPAPGIGQHDSLGAAVSKALGVYYLELVAEGVVPPNL